MVTTVIQEKENKDSKGEKQKILINTMAPNFKYKNKKGETVDTKAEVSF